MSSGPLNLEDNVHLPKINQTIEEVIEMMATMDVDWSYKITRAGIDVFPTLATADQDYVNKVFELMKDKFHFDDAHYQLLQEAYDRFLTKEEEDKDEAVVNDVNRLRGEISNLSGETPSEVRLNMLAERSYKLMTLLGTFIRDRGNEVYYFSNGRHRIFAIQTQVFNDLVSTETGVNQASTGFRYILALVAVRARGTAQAALIARYTHYDKAKATLCMANNAEHYLRITPDEITIVPNGTDSLYLSTAWRFDPFEYEPALAEKGESVAREILVDTISFDDGESSVLNNEEQRILYWYCVLALHFLTASRTKPPLTFLGEPGSGKTTALRILGTALFGERFEVLSPSSDERDIVAAITKQVLAVLDNLDRPSKFLDDLIARLSTGISFTRRKLYSDNDEFEVIPRAQLGITSMQPHFDREDVADRLIIFRLHRHENTSFRDEGAIVSEILEQRTVILSGIIHALQHALKNIEKNKDRFTLTTFRMADAALLLIRMSDDPTAMMALIAKMQQEQTRFLSEGNPLTELLCQWLRDNPRCEDTFYSTADLFSELNSYAQEKKMIMVQKTVKSLGMALTNQRHTLDATDCDKRSKQNKQHQAILVPIGPELNN